MIIIIACDECGEDHILNTDTKEIQHTTTLKGVKYDAVSYEDDEITAEIAKRYDMYKWRCRICGEISELNAHAETKWYL